MVGFANCLAVAAGGALGCVCRWGVSLIPFYVSRASYWPTLTVNVAGCLAIGIVAALYSHYSVPDVWYRFTITGFLGGFTTYSAFALDAMRLVQNGCWADVMLYVGLTLLLGFVACMAGMIATDRILNLL